MSIYNSRVLVEDEGYIKINSAQNLNVWNGEEFTSDVVRTQKEAVKLVFGGSNSIICSTDTKFYSKVKRLWIKAEDLKSTYVVMGSPALPDFDCLELSQFKYLSKLNSYNAGLLTGFTHFFSSATWYQMQYVKTELRQMLEYCLTSTGATFKSLENSNIAKPCVTYIIDTRDIRSECMALISTDGLSEDAWKSKSFLKGYLKVLVESTVIRNDKLVFKFGRNLAKDIQQALLIFGINSYTTQGLNVDSVTVNKEYFPMIAKNIGTVDLSKNLKLYNNNFYTQATSKKPLTFKILDVTITNKYVEMFETQDKLVSNGLIMC